MATQLRSVLASSAATSTSHTFTKPSGVLEGDLMLLELAMGIELEPSAVPSGWDLVAQETTTGGTRLNIYAKTAGASEPADYTFTWASSLIKNGGIIALYSDLALALSVDDSAGQTNSSSTNRTWPSVTTTVADTVLCCFGLLSSATASTPDAAMTEQWDTSLSLRIYAMTQLLAAIGPTGTRVATGIVATASKCITVAVGETQPFTPGLDASLTTFLQVQAARQSAFDDPALPTIGLPVVFEYADGDQDQIAAWDAGLWTGLEIVERVAKFATFTLRGVLFFELMPLLLAAGFAPVTPSGTGPYTYADSVAPGATGTPSPYTFRFGGNDGNRSPTSMVQVQDAYLSKLTLTMSQSVRVVTFDSEWFGRFVDDNDGLGYEPEAVTLPSGLRMVNGLLSGLGLQDAGATGGAFDALTALACELMEWTLTLDTGLRPAWAGDGNNLSYCGVRQEWPGLQFAPTIRTNIDTYALVMAKAQARTYQELQLAFAGGDDTLSLQMTGRWQPKLNAHERLRGEIVLKPVFEGKTPHTQTTDPHWLSYEMVTGWQHG